MELAKARASRSGFWTPTPSSPSTSKVCGLAAAETGGRVVVVEDHYPAGGLGEAVAAALAGRATLRHLCVREQPHSGKPEELIDRYGIGARSIAAAVKELLA